MIKLFFFQILLHNSNIDLYNFCRPILYLDKLGFVMVGDILLKNKP